MWLVLAFLVGARRMVAPLAGRESVALVLRRGVVATGCEVAPVLVGDVGQALAEVAALARLVFAFVPARHLRSPVADGGATLRHRRSMHGDVRKGSPPLRACGP